MEDFWTVVGAWLATGLILAMYSFLYNDNPFFKIAEHIFLGVSVGYFVVFSVFQYIHPKLVVPLSKGELDVIFPAVLGLLILTRLVPPIAWMSRLSFAAIMGYTSGLYVPTAVRQLLLPQVGNTIQPLIVLNEKGEFLWTTSLNNLLILVGVVSVLVHFFYSVEHKGAIRWTARLGVMFLMFGFGAMFGNTTMGRMSLLFGVTNDLVSYSSPRYGYATPILLVLIIGGIVIWELYFREQEEVDETVA